MEYSLMALFLIIQGLFNTLLNLQVTDGVPLGGIFIACMILGAFLHNFRMRDGSGRSGADRSSKQKDGE